MFIRAISEIRGQIFTYKFAGFSSAYCASLCVHHVCDHRRRTHDRVGSSAAEQVLVKHPSVGSSPTLPSWIAVSILAVEIRGLELGMRHGEQLICTEANAHEP